MKLFSVALLIFLLSLPAYAEVSFQECYDAYKAEKPEAASLCLKFAEAGNNREAMKILGDMRFWGWAEIEQDYEKALMWYKRAAAKGQVEAKYNVGVMYEQGMGTDIDYNAAAKWYMSAARDGWKDAQLNLGNLYAKGAGLRQDDVASATWYERAANQGDAQAQYNIGNRYAKGLGVSQDLIMAYKWYTLAEKAGDKDATRNKGILAKEMQPAEVEQAESMAKNWKPELE